MKKLVLIGFIVGSVVGAACYLGTNSLILGISIVGIILAYFSLILVGRFAKFDRKIKRFHECYFFISNMIVTLSIKSSISAALGNIKNSMSDDFIEEMETMKEMKENEKLIYLEKYFPFHFYQLFVDVVSLWVEQGGNIIEMTERLIYQAREVEEYIVFSEHQNKAKLVEFIVLWAMFIAIVIVLRFALSVFFQAVSSQMLYRIGIFTLFLFMIFSIELMSRRMCDIEIKGAEHETK